MALARHKIRVVYGKSEVIELTGQDWLKVLSRTFLFSEATGDRPEGFVPKEPQISFDGEPEVSLRSGLELRPDGGFTQVTIFNPNEGLPIEIDLLMGTGDIRDSSVTFNIDPSQALAVNVAKFATDVSLPTTVSGSVRLDNEYHLYNPLGVVFRGGAGTAPTTPLFVQLPEGSGTGMAVSGEVSITNTAENPVQTTLAGVSEAAPLCVSLCDISVEIGNALVVADTTVDGRIQHTNTLITATNGKLDITNNGLGSIAQGIAGLQTTASADRTNNANTANALGTTNTRLNTIATNTARGTMENPMHTTAVFDGTLGIEPSTHAAPTFTRHTRISEYFAQVRLPDRLHHLGSSSFLTGQESFSPQLITIGVSLSGLTGFTDLQRNEPLFDFSFLSQVQLLKTDYNRKKVSIKVASGAVMISREPFALPITDFSVPEAFTAVLNCLYGSWINRTTTENSMPLINLRNVNNNVISGSGFWSLIRDDNIQGCGLASGGLVNGRGVAETGGSGVGDSFSNLAFADRDGTGAFSLRNNIKYLQAGETFETESHRPIYVLSAENNTTTTANPIQTILDVEESHYDTE